MKTFEKCKACEKRYPGCHGECEAYKADRAEWDKRKAAVSEARMKQGDLTAYYKDSYRKKRDRHHVK